MKISGCNGQMQSKLQWLSYNNSYLFSSPHLLRRRLRALRRVRRLDAGQQLREGLRGLHRRGWIVRAPDQHQAKAAQEGKEKNAFTCIFSYIRKLKEEHIFLRSHFLDAHQIATMKEGSENNCSVNRTVRNGCTLHSLRRDLYVR